MTSIDGYVSGLGFGANEFGTPLLESNPLYPNLMKKNFVSVLKEKEKKRARSDDGEGSVKAEVAVTNAGKKRIAPVAVLASGSSAQITTTTVDRD